MMARRRPARALGSGAILALLGLLASCDSPGQRASDGARQAGFPASQDSLFDAGLAVYADARFDSARTLWTISLASARARGDSLLEARLLTELGLAARNLGNPREARTRQDSALALKRRLGMRDELARSLNALGLVALSENRNAEAAEYFEQSRDAAAAVGDSAGIRKAIGNAALAYGYLGDLVRARRGHRVLRAAGQSFNNPVFEANGLTNEALVDIAEGDPAAALARLDTARGIYARAGAGRVTGEQNLRVHVATAHAMRGEYSAAFASLDTALQLARRHGLKEKEIEALRLLGGLHRRVGDHRGALRYYADAESIARGAGVAADLAMILRDAATSHALAGNLVRARESATEALRLHRESGEVPEQVDDLLLLAKLEGRSGRAPSAARHISAAALLASQPSIGTRLMQSQIALARAREADRVGDGRSTLAALRAVDSVSQVHDFETQWTSAALSARAHARLGRFDSAAAHGAVAVAALERMRGTLSLEPLRESLAAERVDVYGNHILTLLRLGRTEEAFEVADRARGRALQNDLTAIGERRGGSGIPAELIEGELILRRIEALLQRLRATTPGVPPGRGIVDQETSELSRELAEARSRYEALIARAARRDPRALALLGSQPVPTSRIQATLAADEVLLEYFLTGDRVVVFVVTRERLRAFEWPLSAAVLASRIRLLRDYWSTPRPDWRAALGASRALYRDLIAPLETELAGDDRKRLVIIPHGILAQAPLAALQHPSTHRFLMERFAITRAPSGAAFSALRSAVRERTPASRGGQAFAPFDVGLPASAREAQAVAEAVPGARRALGGSATETRVREALSRSDVVHLATHGVANAGNPMFSRIELARERATESSPLPAADGRLETREVLGMDVRSRLVFLSGCETGAVEAWLAEGVRGASELPLSHAFLSAGAANVVSTLWRIDDEGAAGFATAFYEQLTVSGTAEALAAAQRSLARGTRFASPYYWASYVLSGDGRFTLGAQTPGVASVY